MFFTNIFIAMNCIGKKEYDVNVVEYTVNSMDPDVNAEMEAAYSNHLKPRTCDPVVQTRVV